MKKRELQNAIAKLKKINAKNNIIPILDNVLNDNGKMTASCLNIEHTINVGFTGKFMLNLKVLDKIVRKLPVCSDIDIKTNGVKIYLTVDSGAEFYFACEATDDFPLMDVPKKRHGSIDSNTVDLMKRASSFAAKDELRPVMQCICLTDRIVSSDAHRLVFYDYKKNIKDRILVDTKTASVLSSDKYDVLISDRKNQTHRVVKFSNEYESVTFRETEGSYPAYSAVIPSKATINYRINRNELEQALNLALLASNSATGLVIFSFEKDKLKITTSDLDYDMGFNKTIECFPVGSAGYITIGFKGTFLLSLLGNCGNTVHFGMTDPSHALIIDDDALLMPMMITN